MTSSYLSTRFPFTSSSIFPKGIFLNLLIMSSLKVGSELRAWLFYYFDPVLFGVHYCYLMSSLFLLHSSRIAIDSTDITQQYIHLFMLNIMNYMVGSFFKEFSFMVYIYQVHECISICHICPSAYGTGGYYRPTQGFFQRKDGYVKGFFY